MRKRVTYIRGDRIGPNKVEFVKELPPFIGASKVIQRKALFLCECGIIFEGYVQSVREGKIRRCGCIAPHVTHNLTGQSPRICWCNIKQRCYNPKYPYFKDYGGRGIIMYGPWLHDAKAFCEYITALPHFGEPGRSLDRIENDGSYEPGNLRWATQAQQSYNKRTTKFKHDGYKKF